MEPATLSLNVAKRSLDEEGFFRLGDSELGKDILEMERRDFPFDTADGLDFCRKHVLVDEVSSMTYSPTSI